MLYIVSPAKSLDFTLQDVITEKTYPIFNNQANELASIMNTFSSVELQKLLGISEKLAQLNLGRYNSWAFSGNEDKKQAVFAFTGDVYVGIDVKTLSEQALINTQKGLRILSGLYGVLKPFDMILPYRLEMGTKLETEQGKNLYEYWGSSITDALNIEIDSAKHEFVLNLASNEYFKVIKTKELKAPIIHAHFKDYKNGNLKVISFFAKKARGLMARYIAENSVSTINDLKLFTLGGYSFDESLSNSSNLVFTR